MDTRGSEHFDEVPSMETPDDVAVLYSWANLHGAKYRDFSASRREYRAQLRHRAAEQARELELRAKADSDDSAAATEKNAQQAEQTDRDRNLAEGQQQQRLRSIEEPSYAANAPERRPAAPNDGTELREGWAQAPFSEHQDVPGKTSDPYTPELQTADAGSISDEVLLTPGPPLESRLGSALQDGALMPPEMPVEARGLDLADSQGSRFKPALQPSLDSPRAAALGRPQGYRPDDASGVRQIYRPEVHSASEIKAALREPIPVAPRPIVRPVPPYTTLRGLEPRMEEAEAPAWTSAPVKPSAGGAPSPQQIRRTNSPVTHTPARQSSDSLEMASSSASGQTAQPRPFEGRLVIGQLSEESMGELLDPTPKRRRQDLADYSPTDLDRAIAADRRGRLQPTGYAKGSAPAHKVPSPELRQPEGPVARLQRRVGQAGPAWINTPDPAEMPIMESVPVPDAGSHQPNPSPAETVQWSRERVASRWYALMGVFEQAEQEREMFAPVLQKETRTPVLAVFSLAGGVGKTSLVATLGRSLSSMGEKVLLTDTTSHGLLPYYFGASELRQGSVRTFSPPIGSPDAPIYLVNYGVDQERIDEAAQGELVEEIVASGRGTHRIVLDLTPSTSWLIRRMAHLTPTVLVPLAPDMNSVISLQAIENFFNGATGTDAPLKFFYVINQFDAALPLHLDVREVLRRQLGDRLLPFVIRRAPAVSEALAEGMTIIDYSPEAPVIEDYLNLANWLRSQFAPAAPGFRNVRWSER